jgi:hypothetical protein
MITLLGILVSMVAESNKLIRGGLGASITVIRGLLMAALASHPHHWLVVLFNSLLPLCQQLGGGKGTKCVLRSITFLQKSGGL